MKIDILNLFSTRSIGRDLFFGLIPVIVIVASVVGSINYFINTKRGVRLLKEQSEETTENLARILANPIFNSMHNDIFLIGRGYRQMKNVVSVSIFDKIHNNTYLYNDNNVQGPIKIVKKPITLFDNKLGYVEVMFTMNSVIQQQKQFLFYTITITFFIILAVGVASVGLLEMFLRKPFLTLIDGVSSIASGFYEHKLAPLKRRDMNLIAQNVNIMADKIAAREQRLKRIVKELRKKGVEQEEAKEKLEEIKERFKEMTNLLPETVYETDERTFLTFLNRSGFERFGYDSVHIKKGLKFIDLFTAQDTDRLEKNIKRVLSGREIGSSEYSAETKNGETFQALVHFNPIVHHGKIRGIRGIAVDITERTRFEKELLSYQEKLRSLTTELLFVEERERHQIASELHDRIGHALTNVSMKINLLKNTANHHEKDIILKDINQLIEQSARDIQSLIFEISPPILYDFGLVAAIDWLVEKTSKEHGLKIVFKHDDELKPICNSSRVLIFQAVRELMFNVIKHANAKKIIISITRQRGNLLISVQDDGIGMPTDSTGSQFEIEGFGLFSIRERLNHLNGSLAVHSKPHEGTLVMIEVPDT